MKRRQRRHPSYSLRDKHVHSDKMHHDVARDRASVRREHRELLREELETSLHHEDYLHIHSETDD
jgi:hypothetical protein